MHKWIQTSFPVSSLNFLFYQKRKNRRVVRKGIHKKRTKKEQRKYPDKRKS